MADDNETQPQEDAVKTLRDYAKWGGTICALEALDIASEIERLRRAVKAVYFNFSGGEWRDALLPSYGGGEWSRGYACAINNMIEALGEEPKP